MFRLHGTGNVHRAPVACSARLWFAVARPLPCFCRYSATTPKLTAILNVVYVRHLVLVQSHSFVNKSHKGYEMLRKPSLVAASLTAGMIVSATVSADIVIQFGAGLTQTLVESSIHYEDLGNDDIDWPAILSNYEGDTQLGQVAIKVKQKPPAVCSVLGKGYDLQVVPDSSGNPIMLPNGMPLIVPAHLRHVISCVDPSDPLKLSRLNTDGDTPVSFSPYSQDSYPCKWAVTEIMNVRAPRLRVGPIDVPGNTGMFANVTGGTITAKGVIDVCSGQNVFTSITGKLLE